MSDNLISAGVLHVYRMIDAITFWKEVYVEKAHHWSRPTHSEED